MTTTVLARPGLPVTITAGGGAARGFVANVEQVTWLTMPPTRQGVDQGAGPGEQALSNEVVWRRSRESWHLGAGQDYADLLGDTDEDVARLRFRSSSGADPWTKRGLSVLPTAASKRASANTNLRCLSMRVAGTDYLVVVDGGSILYSSDPTATTPTFTAHTGLAGTFTDITTDGQRWWAANGTDIYVGTPGTPAATVLSAQDADIVGYANGRLLAAKTNVLYEISSTGVATEIYSHPSSAFVWTGIIPSPAGIYVFGDLGDTSEVYVVTAIDTTGQLDVPFVVAPWPQGERIRTMCSYAGVMVIATTRGIRLALITGGGFLSYGPLVDEPGDVLCLEPQLEDVWFGWTQSSSVNGLGRLRLSRFVEELVPAFASDLAARGTVSGNVLSVCTVGTRRYFAISGRGFYGETTTLETTATVDLGWFGYGIAEPKMLDSLAIWCDALPTGGSIVANVYPDDSAVSMLTLTMNTAAQTKENVAYTGTATPERCRVVLTITTNGTNQVTVRRVTLRAAPRPFIAERITLPLMLGEAAVDPASQVELGMDPYTEWALLRSILQNRERCTVTFGVVTFDARIEALEVEKGGLGGGNGLDGFDDQQRFVTGTWDVAFMTLEPSG